MKNLLTLVAVAAIAVITCICWPDAHEGYYEEEERQSGANKQLLAWWWQRAYPEPGDINEKFYNAWLHARSMRDSAVLLRQQRVTSPTVFGGNWIPIGPNQNIGGRILCIAVDPQNNNRLFAGSASGGIWKSVTGGVGTTAWQPVQTGFPLLGVSSIIINPTNSNIIYAGTGEVYRADTSNIGFNVWKARGTYGVGILKSVDGGQTWSRVFNKSMQGLFGVQMLAFDPVNSSIVYACTTEGLFRSTNAGTTWINILNKTYVSDVAIHPTNRNVIVAAVGNLQNSDKGIYRTTDGGSSWIKITSGLPASFEGFIRLDNVAESADMIVASVGRSAGTSQNELYRSTDFGVTWTALSNSNHCQYQFWFAHDVAIDPSNINKLMMGGVPLYNFTLPSTRASVGGVHADIHDIVFDPVNNNNVYVACDGGVYKSTNGGASFSMINGGLYAVQFYASIAVSPSNPNIIIGGLQDNGIVRYNGTSWSSVAGGDGGACAFNPTNSSIVFASNDARRLLRSANGGTGFSEVLSSWAFAADSRTSFMAPMAISKSSPSLVYVASDNLHKSSSGGTSGSWNGNSYTSATNYIEAKNKTAIALAVAPDNGNKLYVSTSPFAQYDNDGNDLYINPPPNILKSINGGTSFTSIKNGLPDRFVMDFAISATNNDSVWIVLGGFGTSHVYVTGNGGLTWTAKGNGLPDVPHNAILIDPRDRNVIYVGNDIGVYMSPDLGNTWYDYNSGMWDATQIMDLQAAGNSRLVAATHGKGVFVSDLYMVKLPFILRSFTGVNKGAYNELRWATANEEGGQGFELERSVDGINWQRIAAVAVGGAYSFKDDALPGAIMYYRLKLLSTDGTFTYSNVVMLRTSHNGGVVIGPNPFHNEIGIKMQVQNNEKVTVKLFDASGKMVYSRSFNSGTFSLQGLQYLPDGSYTISVITNFTTVSKKLLKR